MGKCRWHHPAGEGGYTRPNGSRDVCLTCGRPIVFIEGYEMRRDYWRALPGQRGGPEVASPAARAVETYEEARRLLDSRRRLLRVMAAGNAPEADLDRIAVGVAEAIVLVNRLRPETVFNTEVGYPDRDGDWIKERSDT